ncbi:MAG: tryptophan--tRNA ligase, partial [Dehalococcoidia bacterium]|nr:tryptophan--tRNA ligase [Dehalococcoidia bacterium]
DADTVSQKVRAMFGGPPRAADEPGNPDENPILMYLEAFDPDVDEVANIREQYATKGIGNKVLKDRLNSVLDEMLEPIRDRRASYGSNMRRVRDALAAGSEAGRTIAIETMEMVHDALDLNYLEKY